MKPVDLIFIALLVLGLVLLWMAHPDCVDEYRVLAEIEACYADNDCVVSQDDMKLEMLTRGRIAEWCGG